MTANAPTLPATADSKSLRNLGFALGSVTAAVAIIASVLVHTHADGRPVQSDMGYHAVGASSFKLAR
jgi:hypothetical protein